MIHPASPGCPISRMMNAMTEPAATTTNTKVKFLVVVVKMICETANGRRSLPEHGDQDN
jgi:hypothetical protein